VHSTDINNETDCSCSPACVSCKRRLANVEMRVDHLEKGGRNIFNDALRDGARELEEGAADIARNARVRMLVTLAGSFFGSAAAALAWEFFRRFGMP
jgi:hypothetical protein